MDHLSQSGTAEQLEAPGTHVHRQSDGCPQDGLHAGTVKGLTSQQLVNLDCHVILGNTYHLENRPGSETVAQMGGLHGFINWRRGMLTDSGGFQVTISRVDPCSS